MTMPAMMHSSPENSSELWLDNVLIRVETSANVPNNISIMPKKGVNFFIKSLNLLQIY